MEEGEAQCHRAFNRAPRPTQVSEKGVSKACPRADEAFADVRGVKAPGRDVKLRYSHSKQMAAHKNDYGASSRLESGC